tara:strand:+ start:135 stop:338 length:204 start_codon:yes stop_codon:yes gene_type:complete
MESFDALITIPSPRAAMASGVAMVFKEKITRNLLARGSDSFINTAESFWTLSEERSIICSDIVRIKR